jgi:hypothetical protein
MGLGQLRHGPASALEAFIVQRGSVYDLFCFPLKLPTSIIELFEVANVECEAHLTGLSRTTANAGLPVVQCREPGTRVGEKPVLPWGSSGPFKLPRTRAMPRSLSNPPARSTGAPTS